MKTGYNLPHFRLFFLSPVINRQGRTAFQVWKAWQRLHHRPKNAKRTNRKSAAFSKNLR